MHKSIMEYHNNSPEAAEAEKRRKTIRNMALEEAAQLCKGRKCLADYMVEEILALRSK